MIRLFHVSVPIRTLGLIITEATLCVLALASTHIVLSDSLQAATLERWAIFKILLTTGVCMLCMHYFDLYDSAQMQKRSRFAVRLAKALAMACAVLWPLYYWFPATQLSYRVLLTGVLFAGLLLVIGRSLAGVLSQSKHLSHPAVLVGNGPLFDPLLRELQNREELGCRVLGLVHMGFPTEEIPRGVADLGSVEDLPFLVEREKIDRVIVTVEDRTGRLSAELLLRLKTHGVAVEDACDAYEAITERVLPDGLRAARVLFSDGFYIPRALRVYKRLASILLASFGILVSFPIQILIAIAIKLDSSGPAIFKQERIGKDGRPFVLFKFRTMVVNADPNRPAQKNDDRCTRLGRWLRRSRLDELPQLFNILIGDMHLVGPRPFTRVQEDQFAREIPFYTQRWAVSPGLTGWAQIHRPYCATLEDNIEKLSYDLFYIKNLSVGLDMVILFETIKTFLLRRGSR